MKKISLYIVASFSMIFFLVSCYTRSNSSPAEESLPSVSETPTFLPTVSFNSTSTVLTPTTTSTLDYEKLGLPSPTATPTFDYVQLASHYLTPFPTSTAIIPSWTPTPTPENPLSDIVARQRSSNDTPTPPPLFDYRQLNNSIHIYLQVVTDAINFTDAEPKLYDELIESWKPENRSSTIGATWILQNDFDYDGQPEWLVSTPVFFNNEQLYCCGQLLVLFEKAGGLYQPMHYDWKFEHANITKVVLVNDLNNDGYSEIVLRTVSCGTACGQLLTIATWDGKKWTDRYIQSVPTSLISFVDRDNDGKTEIIIDYWTAYKLDSLYPERTAIDVYGWKNGQLVILEEFRLPTTDTYGILRDIYSAISFGKIDDALDLAKPVIDNFEQKCEQKETYIGIEAMFAYGIKNDPTAMQSVLSKINAHCSQPNNGFAHAANVFWQAYQQIHEPAPACEAMKRFIINEVELSRNGGSSLQFFDATVMLPKNYYNFCPFQQEGG